MFIHMAHHTKNNLQILGKDETCLPSSIWVPAASTVSTQLGSLKFTKPNPRDFPVVGFVTTTQSSTSPNRLKYWSSDAKITLNHCTLAAKWQCNNKKYTMVEPLAVAISVFQPFQWSGSKVQPKLDQSDSVLFSRVRPAIQYWSRTDRLDGGSDFRLHVGFSPRLLPPLRRQLC